MKKLSIATLAVSLFATNMTTIQPVQGLEKVFNFEPEMKSVALGAGVTAVVFTGLYWFFGKEKPTTTTEKPLTRNDLEKELGPVKQTISNIQEKQAVILNILQASTKDDSPIVQLLLSEFFAQSEDKLQSVKMALHFGGGQEMNGSIPDSPTRLSRANSVEEFPPSPVKRIAEIPALEKLSQCQQAVKDSGKYNISERLWDTLKLDNSCAQAICNFIKEYDDNNAEFDILIKHGNLCKIKITADEASKEITIKVS